MNKHQFAAEVEKSPHLGSVITLSYIPADNTKSLCVSIAPDSGSNLFSLQYDHHDIIYTDQKLLKQKGFTGCFVLFPFPNRVRDFTYRWKGKTIQQTKNGYPVSTHHQLVFDQPFQFSKPVVTETSASVTTWIEITKTSGLYDAFPFPCRLSLQYTLHPDGIRIDYTVKNTGTEELPFGIGLHPYFSRLSGDDKTFITSPARSWMETDPQSMLPTGNLIDVSGKSYNVTSPRPVGKLSLDHVYTDITSGKSAVIDYRTLGFQVSLDASEDFTHLVVYTGEPHAVCIENQTCSTDAHNLYAAGYKKESHILIVPPGKTHSGYIRYRIRKGQ